MQGLSGRLFTEAESGPQSNSIVSHTDLQLDRRRHPLRFDAHRPRNGVQSVGIGTEAEFNAMMLASSVSFVVPDVMFATLAVARSLRTTKSCSFVWIRVSWSRSPPVRRSSSSSHPSAPCSSSTGCSGAWRQTSAGPVVLHRADLRREVKGIADVFVEKLKGSPPAGLHQWLCAWLCAMAPAHITDVFVEKPEDRLLSGPAPGSAPWLCADHRRLR